MITLWSRLFLGCDINSVLARVGRCLSEKFGKRDEKIYKKYDLDGKKNLQMLRYKIGDVICTSIKWGKNVSRRLLCN
jgi:hypothetical protein